VVAAAAGHEDPMVFHAAGRRLHAVPVRRPVGRQLFRTQLDPVRAQQVPSRAVRGAAAAAVPKARGRRQKARVHSPGETRRCRTLGARFRRVQRLRVHEKTVR